MLKRGEIGLTDVAEVPSNTHTKSCPPLNTFPAVAHVLAASAATFALSLAAATPFPLALQSSVFVIRFYFGLV